LNAEQITRNFHLEEIRGNLLGWWNSAGQRHFPWRDSLDPFRVLVAEILLHRTRADQVVPLYQAFLEKYPNIHSVVQSSTDELVKSFRSAGLHWRWKLLHSAAIDIETRFSGQIPQSFEDLTSLPGVSHYIASAIRCFAFGYSDVLLDTNTVRVAGRIFGLSITDASRRSRLFREVLERLIDTTHPREFNFALIDLAAAICKPKFPSHQDCSISKYCTFYQEAGGETQKTEDTEDNVLPLKDNKTVGERRLNVTEAR
jgi:A/G-specific adenine glycosylase